MALLGVHADIDSSQSVELISPTPLITWTITFWLRITQFGDESNPGIAMALKGEPLVGLSCPHELSLFRDGSNSNLTARWEDVCEEIDVLVPFVESPAANEWVFVAITFDDTTAIMRWCQPCDEQFTANRSVSLTVQAIVDPGLILGNSALFANGLGGDLSLANQWDRVLSDTELLAEKLSQTFVATGIWSSNPLQGETDDSDASGNGRLATLDSLTTVLDGPVLCPLVTAACDEMGRATRAYVSAYQRARVHQSSLYRFERRCFVANFNGAFPPARTITSATWRTDAPEIGIISTPQISANGRETMVMFASQLGGWANLRVDATLDNGEIYTQVFRVNVREASFYFDDPPTQAGPFSLTVVAP